MSSFPTPIHHVFVIYLENRDRTTVLADGPFERYLADHYAQASQFYGICHPSTPNYLSGTSGESLQCGTDKYQVYSTTNIVSLLEGAGITNWTGYMQSMPSPCDTGNAKIYVVHHDPFLYYRNVVGNLSYCAQHVVNLDQLNASIAAGTVPAFAWITPNNLDNGANTSVAYSDQWLRGFMSPLLNDSFFRSSVFFVTYDESVASDASGYNGTSGGHVYFAAVSPYSHMGYVDPENATPYNLLSTVEWLLGLGSTGHHDGTGQFPAMKSLFNFSSAPSSPARYPVDGVVTGSNGTGPPGASLSWSNTTTHASVAVNLSGTFSTSLPNGSYQFTALAPGYQSAQLNVTIAGAPVSGLVLSLALLPPVRYEVSGSVTTPNGTLPANASVSWWNSTDRGSTGTNATGGFSVALPNGSFEFEASAPDFKGSPVAVSVAGAPIAGLALSIVPASIASYVVQVSVANGSSGSVIDGARVAVRGVSMGLEGLTDPSGDCSFALVNGTYRVWVNVTGYVPLTSSWTIAGANASYHFGLEGLPSTGNSSGTTGPPYPVTLRVVIAGTNLTLANRSCTIMYGANQTVVAVITDSQGTIELRLPNGTYHLRLDVPGYSAASVFLIVKGPSVTVLTLPVEPYDLIPTAPPAAERAPVSWDFAVTLTVLSGSLVCSVAALGAFVIRQRTR